MSLSHKCPYCDIERHFPNQIDYHISKVHGYWAGYKYRVKYNVRRSNLVNFIGNTVGFSLLVASILFFLDVVDVW